MKDYNNYKKINLSIKLPKVEAFLSNIEADEMLVIIFWLCGMGIFGALT